MAAESAAAREGVGEVLRDRIDAFTVFDQIGILSKKDRLKCSVTTCCPHTTVLNVVPRLPRLHSSRPVATSMATTSCQPT